ncbi:MAG: SDR family oxidoreductase [Syntrophaceae bacterium]|nr:SDR family oxidoreductase [Syntrophaceae bacterium]
MKELKGKTAVVTGAGMGMGLDLSRKLLQEGCSVALVDVRPESLQAAEKELRHLGPCRGYVCDISDRQAVYDLAHKIEADMEPPAILVNNAGIVTAAPLLDLDDAAIERMIRVNLTALFWTCKAFLPAMLRRGEGHIVNFASAGGILAIPNLSAYCASKFGVIGFTDSLRQEMRKLRAGIGVTVVCPNTVNTGMFEGSKMVAGTQMLKPGDVTARVVEAIRRNRAMVAVPSVPVKFVTPLMKVLLPIKAMDWLNAALGMADANDTWTGRSRH